MIRRFNYTGRIKIRRADVKIRSKVLSGILHFDAFLNLNNYSLPADALVFIEAYRQTTWIRFAFGTVGCIQAPPEEQRLLKDFETADSILFRIKVTQSNDEHVILASADHISMVEPQDVSGIESLLHVKPDDLGDEMWQLDLIGEPPILIVNKNVVADWRQLATSPIFIALVYPDVLRQILVKILSEGFRDLDDKEDWRSKWLMFATIFPNVDVKLPDKGADYDAIIDWVDDVIIQFTRKLLLKEKFAKAWHDREEGI